MALYSVFGEKGENIGVKRMGEIGGRQRKNSAIAHGGHELISLGHIALEEIGEGSEIKYHTLRLCQLGIDKLNYCANMSNSTICYLKFLSLFF